MSGIVKLSNLLVLEVFISHEKLCYFKLFSLCFLVTEQRYSGSMSDDISNCLVYQGRYLAV